MLIDAHAHLDKYGELLGAALEEIERDQILTLATAMDVRSYRELTRVADRSELVVPTFGVHPKQAPRYADRLSEIGSLIDASPALGEIGLDFHWVEDSSQYPAQEKVLRYFLAAAREQKKIVNLHTKGAEKEILDLLEEYDIRRAIVHWYSGPMDIFQALVQFGAYFTIGVEVLYSEHIRAIARQVPDAQLLTETDNPGGLRWLKGTLGMPRALNDVVRALARLKSRTPETIASMVEENFCRLVGHDPWLGDVEAKFWP